MIEKFLVGYVINFVLSQLDKATGLIDWVVLEQQLDVKIADLVPGTWFDSEVVGWVNVLYEAVEKVMLSSGELKPILVMLAAKQYSEAFDALKELVLAALSVPGVPVTAQGEKVRCILASL